MIYSLTGNVRKLMPPQVTLDVSGVGYLVTVPYPVWEKLEDGKDVTVFTYTYVREDRLDLFGFAHEQERTLFTELIGISGVGPKLALELCSIPKHVLQQAIALQDANMLTQIKGVGRKTAEKLLLDLRSLYEKHPDALGEPVTGSGAGIDRDALAALLSLGYAQDIALDALRSLSADVEKTEDKVAGALRSLSSHRKNASSMHRSR